MEGVRKVTIPGIIYVRHEILLAMAMIPFQDERWMFTRIFEVKSERSFPFVDTLLSLSLSLYVYIMFIFLIENCQIFMDSFLTSKMYIYS